jgi:L-lysine 2,3-aminomutase
MSETHTKTGEGVLVDAVRESPVDKYLLRFRRKVVLVLLLIVIVLAVWCYFCRRSHHRGPAPGEPSSSGYSALDAAPAQEARGA